MQKLTNPESRINMTRYPVPGTRYPAPATCYPLPATRYLPPDTRYPRFPPCRDKSPGVNASTFNAWLIKILSPRQNFVAATCRTNQTGLILCGDKIFNKIFLFTRQNLLLRRVAAICRLVCSGLKAFTTSQLDNLGGLSKGFFEIDCFYGL